MSRICHDIYFAAKLSGLYVLCFFVLSCELLLSPCAVAVDQTKVDLQPFRSGPPRFAKTSKYEVGNLVPVLNGTPLLKPPSRADSLGYYLAPRQVNHWTLTPLLVEPSFRYRYFCDTVSNKLFERWPCVSETYMRDLFRVCFSINKMNKIEILQPINASNLEVEKFRKCLEWTLKDVCFPPQLQHPQMMGAVYNHGSLNVLIDVDEEMKYQPTRPKFIYNQPVFQLQSSQDNSKF